jgi:hypothetical protein
MQKWQNKIRRLRQFLRGWAKNMAGAYKKEKQELMRKSEELDKKAETQLLSQREWDLKQSISERLGQLLREEELKWFQRAKTTKILKGDSNTKYFQMVANGKKGKLVFPGLNRKMGLWKGRTSYSSTSLSIIRTFLAILREIISRWMNPLKRTSHRLRLLRTSCWWQNSQKRRFGRLFSR